MKYFAEITDLTVVRAFFAAWVFAYHVDLHAQFSGYLGPFAGFIRHGYLGVDGFFMLSGLILAAVHPAKELKGANIARFWGKRLARIYPVHLAVMLILLVIVLTGLALGFTPRDPDRFTVGSFVANLLLVQGWGVGDHLAWNYPSWSVSTEWAGYLMFPLLWMFLGTWREIIPGQIMVLCFAVLGMIAYEAGETLNLTYANALWRFFPEFVIGMATLRLVPLNADFMPNKWLTYISLAAILLLTSISSFDILVVFALWVLLSALAMQADAERPPVIPNPKILRFLGQISYSFYMSFGTIELLLAQLFRHQGWDPAANKLVYGTAMTILTLALAIALHRLVETPARRLADRWLAVPEPLAVAGQPL
ncbi:MAG: acyltransferase [Acidocella sp.]|nr:acyltransferase [Acidocella sp.]